MNTPSKTRCGVERLREEIEIGLDESLNLACDHHSDTINTRTKPITINKSHYRQCERLAQRALARGSFRR